MNIAVIGTGYVGLVAATCLADAGNLCIGVDIDDGKIDKLKRGVVPFYEPGLEEMMLANIREERLSFTTDIERAVRESTIIFIAVGTPENEDGSADLQHVLDVADKINAFANGDKIVVLKSTVPVGTNARVRERVNQHGRYKITVVNNPEFLKEGTAVDDFMKPDRVVIGTDDPSVGRIMTEIYAPFVRTGKPVLVMDPASAELTKYAANTMLAARISLMNELSQLCERVGADVEMVRRGIGTDSRVGPSFLFAGAGFGGSCFPKDISALRKSGELVGLDLRMTRATEEVNAIQKTVLFEKIQGHFEGKLGGRRFALWGLAFKPRTDDMREAPAIVLINRLLDAGALVSAFDPAAMGSARRIFGDRIRLCERAFDALPGADALVIMTEWNEFRHPPFDRVRSALRNAVVFDGRNLYDGPQMAALGFTYYSIGRKAYAPGGPVA